MTYLTTRQPWLVSFKHIWLLTACERLGDQHQTAYSLNIRPAVTQWPSVGFSDWTSLMSWLPCALTCALHMISTFSMYSTNSTLNVVAFTCTLSINTLNESTCFVTGQFSGPGTAIDPLCMSVCVSEYFWTKWHLAIWHSCLSWSYIGHVKRSRSQVNVRGHRKILLKWSVRPWIRAF